MTKKIPFAIALAIILPCAILVGVTAYYFNKSVPETSPQPLLSILNLNEISNWKTYKNENYGFEIKYPQDWSVWKEYGYYVLIDSKNNEIININIIPNFNNLTFEKWFSEYFPTCFFEDKKIIRTIDKSIIEVGSVCNNRVEKKSFFQNGNRFYNISLNNDQSNENNLKIYNQIVSTFKVGVGIATKCFNVKFSDYPNNEVYTGKMAEINFNNNPSAYDFRTVIRNGIGEKPNFAGSYTVVTWGCGTSCQGSVVVNDKTGNILPFFINSENGVCHEADSNLLIVDHNWPGSDIAPVEYYRFENEKLNLVCEEKVISQDIQPQNIK